MRQKIVSRRNLGNLVQMLIDFLRFGSPSESTKQHPPPYRANWRNSKLNSKTPPARSTPRRTNFTSLNPDSPPPGKKS